VSCILSPFFNSLVEPSYFIITELVSYLYVNLIYLYHSLDIKLSQVHLYDRNITDHEH
jgi:hypothetical protein